MESVKELEREIQKIESQREDPAVTYNAETALNEQVRLIKLFILSIAKFNIRSEKYNTSLRNLTLVIAGLTLVLVVKSFF